MDTRATPIHRPVEPSGAAEVRSERVSGNLSWSSVGVAIAFGIAVGFAAVAICDSIGASPGEPGWLRWLRIFAEHRIRGSIAASLLFAAFSPRAPKIVDREGSRSA